MPYVVTKGDTMEKIAKNMNMSLTDLIAANPQMQNPDVIQVGDQAGLI